jgi:hypothetical protein
MRRALIIAGVIGAFLLAGCGSGNRAAYRANMACVANELAWHRFVDQARKPEDMATSGDRERFLTLRNRAALAGRELGLALADVDREIATQSRAAVSEDERKGIEATARDRMHKARACLASPAGSTVGVAPA